MEQLHWSGPTGKVATSSRGIDAILRGTLSSSDLALEASRAGVALALAVWIGGTFLAAVAAAKIFGALPSRDAAGRLFGDILAVLDKAKFVAAGALLVGVLLEVQVLGS